MYTVSFEHKDQTDYNALLAMFHAARGMANSFRLFDHSDYLGTGEFIDTGDGSTSSFQLQRTYTVAGLSTIRPIQKPVTASVRDFYGNALTDTVKVYRNGTEATHSAAYSTVAGYDYSLDYTTGVINFFTSGVLHITAVSVSGTHATYTYTVTSGSAPHMGQPVVITGLSGSPNNGTFTITSLGSGNFTVVNASASNVSSQSGTGLIYLSKLAITAASFSGGNTTYTYTLSAGIVLRTGMRVIVSGMADDGNNGTFYITSLGSGTFTVANASGVTHAGQSGTGYTDGVPKTADVITADYQYHVPVRFDLDSLQSMKETAQASGILYTVTGIKLVEVRIPLGSSS
jgi:uncharacterized protein (TIGR02217 family)